jgi:hypothetical protein
MFGSHKRHSQITVSASFTFRAFILSAAKNPAFAVALAPSNRRHKYLSTKTVHDFTASENVVEETPVFAFRFASFLSNHQKNCQFDRCGQRLIVTATGENPLLSC